MDDLKMANFNAFNGHPRYSPRGSDILVSQRGGQVDNDLQEHDGGKKPRVSFNIEDEQGIFTIFVPPTILLTGAVTWQTRRTNQ